jgi:type I restriction enzyme S subunit
MTSPPAIDISPSDFQIVRDILRRHVPDREVWAFGSRVTGKAKTYSDLDLVVMGETSLGLAVSAALSEDFSDSDLPFKVDVVDWAATSPAFRAIIKSRAVAIQTAP